MKPNIYQLLLSVLLIILFTLTSCRNEKTEPRDRQTHSQTDTVYVASETGEKSVPEVSINSSRRTAITRAVERVSPAVVSVSITRLENRIQQQDPFMQWFFPEIYRDRYYQEKIENLGSGFIISEDGFIVTNDHVVGRGGEIMINTSEGQQYEARLIGQDYLSDIALLKVDNHTFPYTELGSSSNLLIGEWTIALGNPFGLFKRNKPSVTVGVVSAVDRDFGQVPEGRIYQDMIQTDASINTGNSGGPLVNAKGEVIGMNTFIYTGDQNTSGSVGIGFAIPIDRIKEIIKGIKEHKLDRDYWIGLLFSPLNPRISKQLNYNQIDGIYITKIIRNSPADKAGLKLGDILVDVNGFAVKDERTAHAAMGSDYLKVGDVLTLKVWREGNVIPVKLVLEKRKR